MAVVSSAQSAAPRPADRWFVTAEAAWVLVAAVGTAVGVARHWPAQFGGAGNPDHVAGELLSKGTVLSPPLWMIALVLAAGLVAVVTRGAWRVTAVAVAGVVGAIGVVGAVGEVVAAPTPAVPRGAELCGAVGVVLSLALVAASAHALLRARRPRP